MCGPYGPVESEVGGSGERVWSGGGRFAGSGPAEDGKGSTVGRKRRAAEARGEKSAGRFEKTVDKGDFYNFIANLNF